MGLPNGIESGVLYNLEDNLHHVMGRRAARKRNGELMGESESVRVGSE